MRRPARAAPGCASGLLRALALGALALGAIPTAASEVGERVYRRWCIHCHAPGRAHPGTFVLERKRGPDDAAIVGRCDLDITALRRIVRGGLLEMPPFRPVEISDDELAALGEYLRHCE